MTRKNERTKLDATTIKRIKHVIANGGTAWRLRKIFHFGVKRSKRIFAKYKATK